MNILTFDIEDWYNCSFGDDLNWDKYEVRIYDGVERILVELEKRNISATFFCLGWLAEKHPDIIKKIFKAGHQIGCHSYQHQLSYSLSITQFEIDTQKSKLLIEDLIGKEVNAFRAPGFSITDINFHYFDVLAKLGFTYDASIFIGSHDFGGIKGLTVNSPFLIGTDFGLIKEFPMSSTNFLFKDLVFSGGGYFRLLPYFVIKYLSLNSDYLMTYFHPRDFDSNQPIMDGLNRIRRFKSYVGIDSALPKFRRYLDDFDFYNIEKVDSLIDWNLVQKIYCK